MECLITQVRLLYLQQRSIVAFVLVVAITVGGIVSYPPLQLAAAVAALGLILHVLLEIDRKVSDARKKTWYPSFQELLLRATDEIEARLQRNQRVSMRWIGVTQEAGWPFAQNLLLKMLEGRYGNGALDIELALLDSDGQTCRGPNGPDHDQVRSTKEKIGRFLAQNGARVRDHGASLAAYLYDYRPTWHGLLIDDDLLFYSTCFPQNLPFASPQGGGEVVRVGDNEESAERVRHCVAWFEAIKSEALEGGKSLSGPLAGQRHHEK